MDNLTDLKYLEQCIKETLRIFTLFPITIRKTTDEIRLNGKINSSLSIINILKSFTDESF